MSMRRRHQTGSSADWNGQAQDPWADSPDTPAPAAPGDPWPGGPQEEQNVSPFPTFAEGPAPVPTPWPGATLGPEATDPASSPLNDLFGDAQADAPAPTASPWAPATASAPVLAPAEPSAPAGDLDDLFGDAQAEAPAPEASAGGAGTTPPVLPPIAATAGDPAFGDPPDDPLLPVATGRQAGPSLAALAGIAPSAGPAGAPGALARRPDRLPERKEVADELAVLYQRIGRFDSLWPAVDQILAAISPNGAIQAFVSTLELTRDHALMAQQRAELEARVRPTLLEAGIHIRNPHDQQIVFDMLYDELVGISVLGPFWVDDRVTEIMVNGFDDITIEIGSEVHPTPVRFKDAKHVQRVALELARKISDRGLTRSNPIVTAELPGARITLVTDPVVKSGISMNLRKFLPLFGMRQLLELGALSAEMAEFLQRCVEARATVLISGGTGTGKTTQINALSEFIPSSERVVTIEDAFELSLSNKHIVSLQTKEKASADDTVVIGQAELLVAALRMRPDRIIVGEIRESAGALTMLQAASTGHDGTMTTVHANSASAALNERMVELIRAADGRPSEVAARSIASAIDLVVHVTRRRGRRYVSEIAVVDASGVQGSEIVPEPVYRAELDAHGDVQVAKVGAVRPDTDLGVKLADHTALGETVV